MCFSFSQGRETIITIDVNGGIDPVTEESVTNGLAEVTSLVLMSTQGGEITRLSPLFKLRDGQEYETSAVLPPQGKQLSFEMNSMISFY